MAVVTYCACCVGVVIRSERLVNAQRVTMPYTQCVLILFLSLTEDANGDVVLRGGEAVMVMGASHRRGHLLVEHKNHHFHVPYQFLELKSSNQSGVDI